MKEVFLTRYAVKGIKSLDQLIELSFYKKTITKGMDTDKYNVKGIYGMNGSGKSAIIASVEILRNLLKDPDYLNYPIVQKDLDEVINKKTQELFIETEFLINTNEEFLLYRYNVRLIKNQSEKFVISKESLSVKKAISKSERMTLVFEVENGEIQHLMKEAQTPKEAALIKNETKNLLSTSSLSALCLEKIFFGMDDNDFENISLLYAFIMHMCYFGRKLHVYMEQSDDHKEHEIKNFLRNQTYELEHLARNLSKMGYDYLPEVYMTENIVHKKHYKSLEKEVKKLYEFLRIFKPDLKKIEIEKRENRDRWHCDLIMVYDSYRIHGEYESTGIKKLVKLYAYFKDAVDGGIVFIDELDANLHDVYLCALLEYFMEFGQGQLCFTTHNVGPMDILRTRKKSIDFLSENHQIYSWRTNGHYSPSKLYRNGMIEGSPFNVDSIDFIRAFSSNDQEDA